MNTTRTWKRIVSILLAVLLVLSATPVGDYMDVRSNAANTTRIIYLDAGVWDVDGAWFTAWVWGGTTADAMYAGSDSDGDGTYAFTIPSDATDVIFLRKDPSSTGLDWNGEWNRCQTTLSSSYNCFSINGWSYGSWSTITVEMVYIVAGSEGLTGSNWSTTDTNNQMTENADGTYSIVYSAVPAGSYEFKILENGAWKWPTDNYVLNLDLPSDVTITYDPATGEGSVSIKKLAISETYDRMDEITLDADSVFYVDADIVDYINDERAGNGQVYGYYTNNQGIWNTAGDSPYSYLNDLISQQTNYTYPMYFGPLNYISSRYSRIVGSETRYSLAKWNSAVNTALADTSGTINTDAAVQGLVGNQLVDGSLVDPVTGETLLYFNQEAANSWTNQGGEYPVMAYYANLQFPFKMNYDTVTRVTRYSYDSVSDYAVYYDYSSNQLYASDTHVLDSAHDDDTSSTDYGFYPLNEPDDTENEVNNGFGVKFTIDFTVGEDGLLANGEHVAFDFTGDDDVWVFIDGVLVLDMGGAHAKAHGHIDFYNKTATVNDAYTITTAGTLTSGNSNDVNSYYGRANSWLYNNNTEERAAVASGESTKDFAALGLTDFDYNAVHTMTVFYVERGMVESNFSMEFTMVPVPSGLTMSKELNESEINAGLLDEISAVPDYNFELNATSPSSTTSVAVNTYTLTEKHTGMATVMTPNGTTSGRTYSAVISGITNYTYAHSFLAANGDPAFIPGTVFSIQETTTGIFSYSGTSWKVYDAKNGYQQLYSGTTDTADFTMGSADDATAYSYAVVFTNVLEVGSLQISKVFNDSALADTEFIFQVYLDLDGSGSAFSESLYTGLVYTVGGTSYTSEDGTVVLKGGETATVSGIPAGATYRVVEVVSDDDPWTLTSSSNTTGTITSGGTKTATFTNTIKSNTQDKTIFVEAGTATDYAVKYNGETVTITGLTNASNGLTVVNNTTGITVTGAEAGKAYTVDYTGRLSNGEIVTGTITVYTYAAPDKVYVFDFGLPSNIAATNNNGDGLFQGGSFYNSSFSGTSAILATLTAAEGNSQTVISATLGQTIGSNGSYGAVTFRPVAFMTKVETYIYTVQITVNGKTFDATNPETGTTLTGTITVMPANTVYYEDNFNVEDADNNPAEEIIFSSNGPKTNPTLTQSNDQSSNYGYDAAYLNGYAQSNGSATTLASKQYAYFTFTGTGFDLLSETNGSSAGLIVYIFTGGHDPANLTYIANYDGTKASKLVFVDTYYNNGYLYQVPVISVQMKDDAGDLLYGTYTVYVQALATGSSKTTVSIDGIRIYDPLSDTSLYPLLTEQNTTVDELRELYGTAESEDSNGIVSLAGRGDNGVFNGLGKAEAVYEAMQNASIVENMEGEDITCASDLESIYLHGPNNEMYLPTNFGISFSYQVTDSNWTLQLGAKAVTEAGTAKSITVYARVSGKGSYTELGTITLSSTTDMYYELNDLLTTDELKATFGGKGTYDIIIISNSAYETNEFVSLTTVKHSGITLI